MANSELGKLGIWSWLDSNTYEEVTDLAQAMEQMGYGTLWIPEAVGRDPFVSVAHVVANTTTLKVATGIANIYARDAMAMNAARQALDEMSGGRLVLGLGVSHGEMVSGLRQHEYGKPLSTMRAYLERMAGSFYAGPQPGKTGILLLAALREKMLGLSGEMADGAHPYFTTPEHTARAREIIGPDKSVAPEQMILRVTDASEARRIARSYMATYLALPNYCNNLLTLGFTEADFADGGSDRLVDAIVAWGSDQDIMDRIEAHWSAGADHVALQCLRQDGQQGFDMETVKVFAPNG